MSTQTEMTFRTWGGKRPRAGRKPQNARPSEPHRKRGALAPTDCVHVVVRVSSAIGSLRRWKCYRAINRALRICRERATVRVVHASIQRTHLHLLVEAADAARLARGMQGFQISAAKHLNRELHRPRGNVFVDRYHATIIRSPRPCRNAIAYVLNNWRKHREQAGPNARLDPFSSAVGFDGWAEPHPPWRLPRHYEPLAVASAAGWLLRTGWAKAGAVSIHEVPSARPH